MTDEPSDDNGNGSVPRIVVPALSSKAMRRPISRAEAIEFITTGVMSMGQKVYDQISAEHARVFAEQHKAFEEAVAETVEALTEDFDRKLAALRAELSPPTEPAQ